MVVDLAQIHGYLFGVTVIASWLVIMIVALILRIAKRDGDVAWFWRLVSIAQVLLAIQLLYGTALFLLGGRPGPDTFTHVFHPLYAFVFPAIVLFYGHKLAREGRIHPLSAFAVVGLVNFGLTARAFIVAIFG